MVVQKKTSETKKILTKFYRYLFLFQELVKRDFKKKYKRTALGMVWSVLSPLLSLFVMKIVFTRFFGRNTPHYTIYLFAGNIVMSYFREATRTGMNALYANASIITKINLPKYLFVFSKNVSAFVNFLLTLGVFFVFCAVDKIHFGFHMFTLAYPVLCLALFGVGVGLILSCMQVFFRDTQYFYDIFLMLLQYLSAIFYTIDRFPEKVQRLFLANPIYVFIKYFRYVCIDGKIPSAAFHGLCAIYVLIVLFIGFKMYRRYNHEFVYYV